MAFSHSISSLLHFTFLPNAMTGKKKSLLLNVEVLFDYEEVNSIFRNMMNKIEMK